VTATDVVGAMDIGGTHATAGRVETGARSVETSSRVRVSLSSDGTRSELLGEISRAASSIARPDVMRLGVAVPGPFDYSAGVSLIAHKLHGLYGVDLRSALGSALRFTDATAVRFVNDADAFVLGEWWAGAARGHARAVGITLGTGLGAAFATKGVIVRSWPGIPADGPLYRQSFRGAPVEETISSGAVAGRYRAVAGEQLDSEAIAGRASGGERSARATFEELGRALAEFLTPWLRTFEPTCLVVGGSIARSWELFGEKLRAELEAIESLQTVTVARHLDDAPLLGAAWYVTRDGS
jgi:predicted NBD/HSP70 family sugar kinase